MGLLTSCAASYYPGEYQVQSREIKAAVSSTPIPVSQESPLPTPEPVFIEWKGTIGNNDTITWDGKDLFLTKNKGKKYGIFSTIAQNYYRFKQIEPANRGCYNGHFFRVLSIVGKIMSFEHEGDFSCQGAYLFWRYGSIDLDKPGDLVFPRSGEAGAKMVKLTDFYSENDILSVLLANREISDGISTAVSQKRIPVRPKTLTEFTESVTDWEIDKPNYEVGFEPDYLTRFVFHHIEGENVAIWISLTPTLHAYQAVHDHIEILLPIPDKLRQPLISADSKQMGFLFKDAEGLVGTSFTSFEYSKY
jgi:hypothetical protein